VLLVVPCGWPRLLLVQHGRLPNVTANPEFIQIRRLWWTYEEIVDGS